MPISPAVLLGVVQGVTEFLPVSSSGHLAILQLLLAPLFQGYETGLVFDVLVHVATLLVAVAYLWGDIEAVLKGMCCRSDRGADARRLILIVAIGTLPAVFMALIFGDVVRESFVSLRAVALGFLVTSILLLFAHRRQKAGDRKQPEGKSLSWKFPRIDQALFIGVLQALALFPGVSRSGATIAGALILGLPAESAVRFSFLLLIPAVMGAMILEADSLGTLQGGELDACAAGFVAAFVAGWFALRWLVMFVKGAELRWFSLYTFMLGMGIFIGMAFTGSA